MCRLPILILGLAAASAGTAAFAIGSNPPPPLTNVNAAPSNANEAAGVYNGYTQSEVDQAAMHAEHAYQAGEVPELHDHLHHVINCLEGTHGPDFDAHTENPCAHMGKGALNDVPADSDAHRELAQALSDAKNGLAKTTVKDAHADAKKVLDDVQKVQSKYGDRP
ncbi:MAG TPA: hypothetical protein VLV87_04405 [Gammaproteobacteria bacterium]|nr:hypothetical protein [Gammaproteobacteria bacterium]